MTIKVGDKVLISVPYPSAFNGMSGVVIKSGELSDWWRVSLGCTGDLMFRESELHVIRDTVDMHIGSKLEDKKPLGAAFYYVMNTSVRGGPPRVKHATYAKAQAEATRLARLQPGDTFVVLKAVTEVKIPLAEPSITELA